MLRDRRTIVTLVAMPLLLYPLLSIAFLQFVWLGKSQIERGNKYICGFATKAEAELFFRRMDEGRPPDDSGGRFEAAFESADQLERELRDRRRRPGRAHPRRRAPGRARCRRGQGDAPVPPRRP